MELMLEEVDVPRPAAGANVICKADGDEPGRVGAHVGAGKVGLLSRVPRAAASCRLGSRVAIDEEWVASGRAAGGLRRYVAIEGIVSFRRAPSPQMQLVGLAKAPRGNRPGYELLPVR